MPDIIYNLSVLINLLTLFPEYFSSPLSTSILRRAQENKKIEINCVNIRDFATDKHKVTDDRPFGGGPGMVMKVEPIDRSLEFVRSKVGEGQRHLVILTSAKGTLFSQETAANYKEFDVLTIICGHYEGVDERVAEHLVDAEVRVGDYVLTGGEVAALVMVESVIRLLPGVLGNEQSTLNESHGTIGQLGFPQYTRPAVYKNYSVPSVLLTGDHAAIEQWRSEQKSQAEKATEISK